ncbi:ATP-binding protein [Nocardia sp. NPDC004604]|uniref:ATP-binding protein n=1 Tax=Nocardia sp. NPDC004604 TaxID=3157013 RepID=UPI0033AC2B9F
MPLFGRDTELKDLSALVDGPGDRSGVLIEGEPGIGKSTLVEQMAAAAAVASLRVLRTAGVEAERNLVFAGLHRLLYPLRREFDALPPRQFDALATALGMSDATDEPSIHLVGLAALTLLADTAADRAVLVVAEDVHWLDLASAEVLAFVARRIDSEPVAMLATLRDGRTGHACGLRRRRWVSGCRAADPVGCGSAVLLVRTRTRYPARGARGRRYLRHSRR